MDVVRIRSVASNRDPPKRSFDQEFVRERSFRDSPKLYRPKHSKARSRLEPAKAKADCFTDSLP